MGDRKSTYFGLPLQTLTEMKMWQMMDQMQPIVERVKETNQVFLFSGVCFLGFIWPLNVYILEHIFD